MVGYGAEVKMQFWQSLRYNSPCGENDEIPFQYSLILKLDASLGESAD